MSAVSEDRSSARWAGDLARTLHAEGGIWETLGRAVGWPTGNYDAWTWVTWEEAARAYGHEVTTAPPASRNAVFLEAATLAERLATPDCSGYDSLDDAWNHGTYAVGEVLRRAAADEQPTVEEPFTEASAAFIQLGSTPSLQGLRAELRIEGYPLLVGRYAGAALGRVKNHAGLLSAEPRLLFQYPDAEREQAHAAGEHGLCGPQRASDNAP
ncbi:hypothetical protein [Streptomyces mirabilis]|uniref:hypothetical protein n=1 Tax=Streptomyces mirabilis TaxID=68239 RepID=UPI0033F65B0B